jgi:hypothetical protein
MIRISHAMADDGLRLLGSTPIARNLMMSSATTNAAAAMTSRLSTTRSALVPGAAAR